LCGIRGRGGGLITFFLGIRGSTLEGWGGEGLTEDLQFAAKPK